MKRFTLSTIIALCLTNSAVHAGGLAPIVNDQVIIVPEPATSSAANLIVPLIILGLVAAASGASGTNNETDEGAR